MLWPIFNVFEAVEIDINYKTMQMTRTRSKTFTMFLGFWGFNLLPFWSIKII